MKIYQILSNGYLGDTSEIADNEGCPPGWTRTAPPAYRPGEYVVLAGDGWVTTSAPPPAAPTSDLEALRTAKNDEINAERERRTFDSFTHAGKVISCDRLSRSDIDGINGLVAINGAFPDVWPGAWKCADNTYLAITTIDEWKAFYGAMVEAGSALYAHAQELKVALAKATTAEEIAAVVW